MQFLAFGDLKSVGVPFSRQYLHRLIRSGRFPRPVKLGGAGGVNYWLPEEVEAWKAQRIAARTEPSGAVVDRAQ